MLVTVVGKIKGKARPRVVRGHAMTPKDSVQYENWVKFCYREQDGRYLEGPIRAKIIVHHKVAKSYSKKKLEEIRTGTVYPIKKPDVDNIAKIILDSLNDLAYHDDAQVVELSVIKKWTEEMEKIEFELEEII